MTASPSHGSDPYAVFGRFYDLEFGGLDDDVDLYREFAREAGGPILELGCGTGRVLAALSDLDLPLFGVDTSDSMLAIAGDRLKSRARLIHADMCEVDRLSPPCPPIWMAFSALNTFLHLPDAEAQIAALEALRRVVVPGGLLLLDLFVPDPHYLLQLDGRVISEFSTTLDTGDRVSKWVSRTHDAATQAIETTVWYDLVPAGSQQVTRYSDHYYTRYVYRFELEHLLARTGWEVVSLFGSYDLEPYGPESDRLISLATWGTKEERRDR
jgi:SAM-dependent methyltransferase